MIYNITGKKAISEGELHCITKSQQMRGLMCRLKNNAIFMFSKPKKAALHMWFVFYPIEVVLLDETKTVIEMKKNFSPFTFWTSKQKASYVIELGEEESKGKINIGDKLQISL